MALIKKPYNNLFNQIQVDSLELSKQLLRKKYYNAKIFLSQDEYNTDDENEPLRKLLWRRGEYQVGFNPSWSGISDSRNLPDAAFVGEAVAEIHTATPYYCPIIEDPDNPGTYIEPTGYDSSKDPSNLDPAVDNRPVGERGYRNYDDPENPGSKLAVKAPYYSKGSNERYAFISLRGVPNFDLGITWEKDSVSGSVDGDSINIVLGAHWVGRNLNWDTPDTKSCPDQTDYEPYILDDVSGSPTENQYIVNPDYSSVRDWSNLDPKEDTRPAATVDYDPEADPATALTNWAGKKGYNDAGRPVVSPYWSGGIYADKVSCPDWDSYDTSSALYNGSHDYTNIAGKKRADGTDATDAKGGYYNNIDQLSGYAYGIYRKDLQNYDETIIDNAPVCSEEDYGKNVIAFTSNSLSTPVATQLTDDRINYQANGTDKVWLPTGKTTIGEGVFGTDWIRETDGDKFTQPHVVTIDDLKVMSTIVKEEAKKSMLVLPEESFHVDTLLVTVAYTKK